MAFNMDDFLHSVDNIYGSSGMSNFCGPMVAFSVGGSSVHPYNGSVFGGGGGKWGAPSSAKPLAWSPAAPAGPSFYELTADRHSGSQPQQADYLDAPWASAYGMSKETAYSEAMENTAYRRSVTDMQKAGLNPAVIFGAGNGYTAGSPSYISSARSGGSGSGRRSGSPSSKSNQNGKLFSGSAYSIISALGGIVGAAATHSAGGYWIGTSLAQGAMSALNAFSGGRR